MTLPLTREEVWQLVLKYNSDKGDLNHYLESEAVCRALASRVGEDPEYFAIAGLIHDIDWGLTKENPVDHLTKAPGILRDAGFDEEFIELIVSHGYGFDCAGLLDKKRTRKEEFILACGETITGLIHAYGLMRGGIEGMQVKGLKKKFKDKRFAAGVSREINGKIDHKKFYGYRTFEVTDYDRPETKEECGEVDGEEVCSDVVHYPHKKTEEGVSMSHEMSVLRQSIVELKGMLDEVCEKDSSYSWC